MTTSHPADPTAAPRSRLRGGLVGAGAAACAVCCAAPLMALVGIGVTGAAATALTAAFGGIVFAARSCARGVRPSPRPVRARRALTGGGAGYGNVCGMRRCGTRLGTRRT